MKSEYEYSTKINSLGYLPGPDICSCGYKKFNIQNLKQNYTSGIVLDALIIHVVKDTI